MTDLFAHFCPAGLANDHYRPPRFSQPSDEMLDMGGFAGPFPSLERDKFAVSRHFLRILRHHTTCAQGVKDWHLACYFTGQIEN